MKLEENNYTDKSGVARTTYKVKKLNEYGNGLTVDTRIEFELSFPPVIRPVNFTDKSGKPKSFESVNILAKPNVEFENVKLSEEYGNAAFQLPPNYAPWVKECQAGDVVTVWLRSFTVQEDGKEITRSTWDCLVNGVSPKADNKPKSKASEGNAPMSFNKPEEKKEEPTIPKEIAEMHKEVGINIPKELNQWLETELKPNIKPFKDAFSNNYDGFVKWIRSPEDCRTDYYVNKSDVEIQALYKELNEKL